MDALVFDFDGLILDTETPLFEAWRGTYQHFGVEPIGLDQWVASLGLPSNDPDHLDRHALLEERLGRPLVHDDVEEIRRRMRHQMLHVQPILPGVLALLDEADRRGMGVAFEDSPHGVHAEKSAGMFAVACPNPISASLDFSHADRVVASLEEVDLDESGLDGLGLDGSNL